MAKASGGTRSKYPQKPNSMKSIHGATITPTETIPGGGIAAFRNDTIYVKPEVMDAVKRLQNGNGNEDDMLKLATLFHEVNHADADLNNVVKQVGGFRFDGKDSGNVAMEMMNEIRSRVLLSSFAKELGIKNSANIDYSKRPSGYDWAIKRLDELGEQLGISKNTMYSDIAASKEHSANALAGILVHRAGIKENNARNIVRNMFGYGVEWEDVEKSAVIAKFGVGAKVKAADRKQAMIDMYGADYPNITKYYSRDVALNIIKKGKKNGTL